MLQEVTIKEAATLKKLMQDFLNDRLQEKLSKSKGSSKALQQTQVYQLENWLPDAARRVSQIQLVTHANKFINPAAKGTSIYLINNKKSIKNVSVSTQTVLDRKEDVVGNAAVLDVFKFLQLSHNDKTILTRIIEDDIEIKAAFPGTDTEKETWLNAFKNIIQAKTQIVSHTLAKQIYFPINNENYHILAPLFPTSLVQAVFEQIQTRFDDTTKAARAARKAKKPHFQGYREYVDIMVQRFGGSKPQNISQLNSNRGGKAYLLPSLPPIWKFKTIKPPLNTKNVLNEFNYQVSLLTQQLRNFLVKTYNNNIEIRKKREDFVTQICDQFLLFSAKIQALPPGWSKNPACKLPLHQRLWLDPDRAKTDIEWQQQRIMTDWQQEVSHDFASWLSKALEIKGNKKMQFADAEYREWKKNIKKLIKHELIILQEAIV